jgi:hypothetical protein
MHPQYILFIYFEYIKCTNKIPNNFSYFHRLLDNMCSYRIIGKKIKRYNTIYYYFDNIKDIYNFIKQVKTIMFNPKIKILNNKRKIITL